MTVARALTTDRAKTAVPGPTIVATARRAARTVARAARTVARDRIAPRGRTAPRATTPPRAAAAAPT